MIRLIITLELCSMSHLSDTSLHRQPVRLHRLQVRVERSPALQIQHEFAVGGGHHLLHLRHRLGCAEDVVELVGLGPVGGVGVELKGLHLHDHEGVLREDDSRVELHDGADGHGVQELDVVDEFETGCGAVEEAQRRDP